MTDKYFPEPREERQLHGKLQIDYFKHKADFFCQPIPEEIQERTREIARSSGISSTSCVLDVGTGTGALIKHFLELQVAPQNIVGCDLCEDMLINARARYPKVNFWCGDILDFPYPMPRGFADHIQAFDAVFFNACFGNIYDQRAALECAEIKLSSEGKIIISHPLGAKFVRALHNAEPRIVPHLLPEKQELQELICELPLNIVQFRHEADLYLAVLERDSSKLRTGI